MKRPSRPAEAVAAVLLALCVLATGCQQNESAAPAPGEATSGMDLRPDTSGAGEEPGALIAARTLPSIDRRLKSLTSLAARVEYTSSTRAGDQRTEVSGTVFVPSRVAPAGGWPVVVYGHPTTGIRPECAPSASPTLLGASPTVAALIAAGYVVTVPDYQGLGVDDFHHPYLDATTAGRNVIDAVRAVRRLVPEASDRWAGVGLSQGGQAVWAANELAAEYGAGLALFGTVSLSPPTDLTGFALDAAAGVLTKQQQASLQLLLASLQQENPDLNMDDYRRGVVAQEWDVLSSCNPADTADRIAAIDRIGPDDLRPAHPEAVARLEALLRERSLPQRPTSAPMLVIFGGRDEFVPEPWTRRALAAACAMGDVIDIQFQPDKGHHDIDVSATYPWLAERAAGLPAVNSCGDYLAAAPVDAPAPPDGTLDTAPTAADPFEPQTTDETQGGDEVVEPEPTDPAPAGDGDTTGAGP